MSISWVSVIYNYNHSLSSFSTIISQFLSWLPIISKPFLSCQSIVIYHSSHKSPSLSVVIINPPPPPSPPPPKTRVAGTPVRVLEAKRITLKHFTGKTQGCSWTFCVLVVRRHMALAMLCSYIQPAGKKPWRPNHEEFLRILITTTNNNRNS